MDTKPKLTKITFPDVPNGAIQVEGLVMQRIARLYYDGKLVEKIDQLPYEMCPSTGGHVYRCCVYHDRAVIRARILSILGFRLETMTPEDEARPLSYYAKLALQRKQEEVVHPVLTILQEACNECVPQQFFVTDLCQNCIAQPCRKHCPKNAITHINGRAFIDKDKCIRCGKCESVCPFAAIVQRRVPCMAACPVDAIDQDEHGHKTFHFDKCIQCGACQRSCPFGAVMPRSQIIDIMRLIHPPPGEEKKPVVAMVAPAVVGHFGNTVPLANVLEACRALGFTDAVEVALGADTTAIKESAEFFERMEEYEEAKEKGAVGGPGQPLPFMTTSCCPAYVRCIRNYVPDIEQAISSTRTPAHYTAHICHEMYPGCKTVFIGPCDAKLGEAIDDEVMDFAMTFHEFAALIKGNEIAIDIEAAKARFNDKVSYQGRGFPVIAGVTAAVLSFAKPEEAAKHPVRPVVIDGLTPFSVKALKTFGKKGAPGNIVEVMACQGGCVNGPGTAVPSVPTSQATGRVKMVTKKSISHPDGHTVTVPPLYIYRGKEIIDENKK